MSNNSVNGKIYHYENNKNIFKGLDENQQIIKLKEFVNKYFVSKNLVIFIGSGCSSGAIPLMSKTMSDILDSHKNVYEKVKEFINCKDLYYLTKSLESYKNWIGEDKNKNTLVDELLKKINDSNSIGVTIGDFVNLFQILKVYSTGYRVV